MTQLESADLVFLPQYQFFSIRDYDLYERAGAEEALTAARTRIIAAGAYEIFVVCAQDSLKVRLTVTLHDEPVTVDPTGWDDIRQFTLPFPTAVLHAGDAFGNAISLNLPHAGSYAVVVQHSGRAEAAAILQRELPRTLPLSLDQTLEVFDHWAGLERYEATVFPS